MIRRTAILRRTPVRRVSKKRARQNRVYTQKRRAFLEGNCHCHRCSAAGASTPLEIHHRKGRIGEMLNREEWWFALCNPCHRWVHENPKQARESGYIISP